MKDIQIRRRILEMVFERFKEHPYHRITPREFKKTLGISLSQLHYNTAYLAEKGYLDLQKPLEGAFFIGARITAKGIDLLEDELQFDIMFPAQQTRAIPENIYHELNLLANAVSTDENINRSSGELIIEGINDINAELQKHEPSYSTIKKLLTNITQRNDTIGSKISTILKTPDVQKLLLRSARKELEDI